jgi:hypothetical protein
MPVLSGQKNKLASIVRRSLASWREHMQKMHLALRGSRKNGCTAPIVEILNVPRYCFDASLLFQRMALLQIKRYELARDEPLLLRELQGRCTLCASKTACVRDLERECRTGEPQDWPEYCPNAATLTAFGILQHCPRAEERL